MKAKHTRVYTNIGHSSKPLGCYIATLDGNRLGERVSPEVIVNYAGDIGAAVEAYDAGNPQEGERILCNLA